jgi:hypothetical protein
MKLQLYTLRRKNEGPFNKLRGLINVFYPVPKGLAVEAYINLVSAKLELNTPNDLCRCLIPSTIYARGLLWINF